MIVGKKIELEGGVVTYIADFLSSEKEKQLFLELIEDTPWQKDKIKLFGKVHDIPRLQAWYGDNDAHYSYSNIDLQPLPWTKSLINLKEEIENKTCSLFNSVLLNLYRNGSDSNGWHSDDEKELGQNPVIASVSLGQERAFHMKHKQKDLKWKINLAPGSLLVMGGSTQHYWKHQIPKSKKPMSPRINLTFRRIFA